MIHTKSRVNRFLATPLALTFGLISMTACAAAPEEKEPWQQAMETEVWEPVPPVVTAEPGQPPSDALVLFDGKDLKQWQSLDGSAARWKLVGDAMEVAPKTGDIKTRESFCDVQLHVEWMSPTEVEGLEGQGRGNSGIFFQERYEVQVLDSHQNATYPNGQAASVYKQHIPLVNATRAPGVWQTYDIIFRAPRFAASGTLESPARVTVIHNGVLVQNHVELQGPTSWIGHPPYEAHACAPLQLQDHGNPVRFRNIWVRKL